MFKFRRHCTKKSLANIEQKSLYGTVLVLFYRKSWFINKICQTFWSQFFFSWLSLISKTLTKVKPKVNQKVYCVHEVDNPYDYFALKTCARGRAGHTVVHLSMEISRTRAYILYWGAWIVATLSTTNYRKSLLAQSGLEIPCRFAVFMSKTVKNKEIIQKCKDTVEVPYFKPDRSGVIGTFVHHFFFFTNVSITFFYHLTNITSTH